MGTTIPLELLADRLANTESFVNAVWNTTLAIYFPYFPTGAAEIIGKYMIYPEIRSSTGSSFRADLVVGELTIRNEFNVSVVIPRIVYEGKGSTRVSENANTIESQLAKWIEDINRLTGRKYTWAIGAKGSSVWFWLCETIGQYTRMIPIIDVKTTANPPQPIYGSAPFGIRREYEVTRHDDLVSIGHILNWMRLYPEPPTPTYVRTTWVNGRTSSIAEPQRVDQSEERAPQ